MPCAARVRRRRRAFGDAAVILERAIADPRHIEIQVFGDAFGNAVHLGERDCSVQRRHQKLIEEAPSPAVTPELRARMGAIAVAAIKSLGYEGAGTLEFLLDESGEFYFMEMNTRLQVEHPVTEAITGLDLVELQLRVAGGEPLGLRQEDIGFSGHAIEVAAVLGGCRRTVSCRSRVDLRCGEAPDGIRVEHALQSGCEIPPFYDSMIAKLIGLGAESRRGAAQAHRWSRTDGRVRRDDQSDVSRCLPAASCVRIGRSDDGLYRPASRRTARATRGRTRTLALVALLIYVTDLTRRRGGAVGRWRRPYPLPLRFKLDGRPDIEVARDRGGGYVVRQAESELMFELDALDRDTIRFRTGAWQSSDVPEGERAARCSLSWHHACGPRSHAVSAANGGGNRQRRQGSRGDERPRCGGAGEKGRAG